MAINKVQAGDILDLTNTTAGAAKSSGDPICEGNITGVCLVDIADAAAGAVDTRGVYDLEVKALDASDADTTFAIGEAVYYDAGILNKDASNGTLFGYALEAIASGATATIHVKLK